MGLATQRRTRIVLVVLAVAALASAIDGVHLWRQHGWNAAITAEPPVASSGAVPAELQFALAHAHAARVWRWRPPAQRLGPC